jgi:D-alanine-D-alanine ligase
MRKVLILCGGQSDEHEISLISAHGVLAALDRREYAPLVVGISKTGHWHFSDPERFTVGEIRADRIRLDESAPEALLNPRSVDGQGQLIVKDQAHHFDVVFPILHGPNGEDGTIQGLFEILNVPYVGANVAASANCMDKERTKTLAAGAGIPVAPWVTLTASETAAGQQAAIEALATPWFVKPAKAGSSVGVHKVERWQDLAPAVADAFRFDNKVLVEQGIDGREIECAVLGLHRAPEVSLPGEIIISPEVGFYSYEAKYLLPDAARTEAPAQLSASETRAVQQLVARAYQVLEVDGMARVDVFLTTSGTVYLNEINTIPGFTPISMYPQMWAASGLAYDQLISRLLELAFEKL